MTPTRVRAETLWLTLFLALAAAGAAHAQSAPPPTPGVPWPERPKVPPDIYEPQIGQAGKDVVWVPTSAELVEKMLDMATVTKDDVVMDLGSGDGRNVIAAAKRGARGIGVEYNPEMVAFSQRLAEKAGVADKVTILQEDMFEADVKRASVLALFLLSDNLKRLRPKFLDMRPGSRIVVNTFSIPEWEPDAKETIGEPCTSWCTALLWIVPAKVAGTWRLANGGELSLQQTYQMIAGTLSVGGQTHTIENGRLRGAEIAFTAGGREYTGRVTDASMAGTVGSESWKATRVAQ